MGFRGDEDMRFYDVVIQEEYLGEFDKELHFY
jgi:hypothetical protein